MEASMIGDLCQQLSGSVLGEIALYALGGLAASGTLAQADAWIPERLKSRLGVVKTVVDAVAGNYRESKNVAPPESPV